MKKITTTMGVFGPYGTVETLADRYRCDGADLPFSVIGAGVISDAQLGDFSPPPAPPAVVPQSVTMRQACIQLEIAGLLDDVEAIVATLPRVYQIEWQRASDVFRDNALVEMVRQQKTMTSEQIDALFIEAATR